MSKNKFYHADPPRRSAFPVARAGYGFIGTAAFATAVLALLELTAPALVGLVATLCICAFFRDPDRVTPNIANAVISPADGKIVAIDPFENSDFLDGPGLKISIFMSVFNVHVNRAPVDGIVDNIEYYPGRFFSANLDKASRENEHNAVTLQIEDGRKICVVQIAGLIARRIVCYAQTGDRLIRGQRFGLICFGSRLDVYLPAGATSAVEMGHIVRAGQSIIGYLS